MERAGLEAFRKRPSGKLMVGVVLIIISSLLGWPAVVLAGWLAVERGNAWVLFVGGPAIYGVSWVIWGLGLLVAGRDSLRYANLLSRYGTRRVVEWLIGSDMTRDLVDGAEGGPVGGAEGGSDDRDARREVTKAPGEDCNSGERNKQ